MDPMIPTSGVHPKIGVRKKGEKRSAYLLPRKARAVVQRKDSRSGWAGGELGARVKDGKRPIKRGKSLRTRSGVSGETAEGKKGPAPELGVEIAKDKRLCVARDTGGCLSSRQESD